MKHLLCPRCEYRARYLEQKLIKGEGSGPRFECGQTGESVVSCYMFKPTTPPILKLREGEERPPGAGILGGRMQVSRLPKLMECAHVLRGIGKKEFIMLPLIDEEYTTKSDKES